MGGHLNHSPTFNNRQTQAMLAGVWARNRQTILQRLTSIDAFLAALTQNPKDNHPRDDARNDAHKLAGSLGMFGLEEGTLLARRVEHALAADTRLDASDLAALTKAAERLRQLIENHQLEVEPAVSPHAHRVLILESSQDVADALVREARHRGMQALSVSDMASASRALGESRRDLLIMDLGTANRGAAPASNRSDEIRDLIVLHAPMQVVALTSSDTFEDRVTAAQLGAHGFLPKTIPPGEILDNCEHLLDLQGAQYTILALVADPESLGVLRSALEPHTMRLTTLSDPRLFWETLRAASPDLVILDTDLPGFSGTELCRAVRNDPAWKRLPVLFLGDRVDPNTVTEIYRAGADDFVAKPIIEVELLTRVRNRLERDRLYRSFSDFDPMTGLRNRRSSSVVIANYLRLSERHELPVSFAVLDLDKFKRVNDTYGHQTGDDVLQHLGSMLKQSFRSEDVVARWSGEEFAVAMFAMRRADAVERIAQVIARLEEHSFTAPDGSAFQITVSGGVAEFPADGPDLHSLYRLADEALYRAKSAGGSRVFSGVARENRNDKAADIVIIGGAAAPLRHALETRGYTVKVFQECAEALAELGGHPPALSARLIVFDDSPQTAIEQVRSLLQPAIPCLILCSEKNGTRIPDTEHFTKPYKTPALMQHIRQMLES